MKGVVLAGGFGTRLYPVTYATNKHLLPIYDKPMVFYPIATLVNAGIKEVLVVTSGPHAGHFIRVLKNGKELGLKHLEYAYQESANGGIADALSLAEDFADEKPITVILADNTTDTDISKDIKSFKKGAKIFLKKVPDPKRFGIAVFDEKDPKKIVDIEEKPKKPKTNFAVSGVYIFDKKVFEYIRKCDSNYAGRGELEITQVNNFYIKAGQMRWAQLKGYWRDAGTFDSMLAASNYWSKKSRKK